MHGRVARIAEWVAFLIRGVTGGCKRGARHSRRERRPAEVTSTASTHLTVTILVAGRAPPRAALKRQVIILGAVADDGVFSVCANVPNLKAQAGGRK